MPETAEARSATPEAFGDKLRMEEFRILRGEIEQRSSEGRTMERNVILIASAIYAFLLTPKMGTERLSQIDKELLQLAWYLPPIFSFLSFIRWRDSGDLIRALAEYIKDNPEKEMKGDPGKRIMVGGWERFLKKRRCEGKNPMVSKWYAVFWVVCIVGSAVVAWIRYPLYWEESRYALALVIAVIGSGIVVSMIGLERMGLTRWRDGPCRAPP